VKNCLVGLEDAGARNIVNHGAFLGLWGQTTEDSYLLTDLGKQVAETGMAPVPEQGAFAWWAVDHPLTGKRLIHVKRLQAFWDNAAESPSKVTIQTETGRPFRSVLDPSQSFVFREFVFNNGNPRCQVQDDEACSIKWSVDFLEETSTFSLEGFLSDGRVARSIQLRPEAAEVDLTWLQNLQGNEWLRGMGEWDAKGGCLRVQFSDLTEDEQSTFKRQIELASVNAGNFGPYEKASLDGLCLAPQSARDASRWAEANFFRLIRGSSGWLPEDTLAHLWVEVLSGTPLAEYEPELPSAQQILEELETEPSVFWRLAAPLDLLAETSEKGK
jgi:hypothetical protein